MLLCLSVGVDDERQGCLVSSKEKRPKAWRKRRWSPDNNRLLDDSTPSSRQWYLCFVWKERGKQTVFSCYVNDEYLPSHSFPSLTCFSISPSRGSHWPCLVFVREKLVSPGLIQNLIQSEDKKRLRVYFTLFLSFHTFLSVTCIPILLLSSC